MDKSDLELYGIVGKMFREIRENKGYTLEYVSNYLNVATKTLQRYELGERDIKIQIIKMLCEFYNIDCSSFMKDAKMRFVSEYKSETKQSFILSDLEKEIIRKFRQLDTGQRDMFLSMLKIEEKRESNAKMA